MTPLHWLRPWLTVFATSLVVTACASDGGGPAAPANGPFRLLPHQSATLGPDLTLTYDSVSDSRCPPGVQCIWAGKLEYRFTLRSVNAVETFELTPDKAAHTSALVPGARIELDTAAVPPAAVAQIPAEKHAVVIRLVRH